MLSGVLSKERGWCKSVRIYLGVSVTIPVTETDNLARSHCKIKAAFVCVTCTRRDKFNICIQFFNRTKMPVQEISFALGKRPRALRRPSLLHIPVLQSVWNVSRVPLNALKWQWMTSKVIKLFKTELEACFSHIPYPAVCV